MSYQVLYTDRRGAGRIFCFKRPADWIVEHQTTRQSIVTSRAACVSAPKGRGKAGYEFRYAVESAALASIDTTGKSMERGLRNGEAMGTKSMDHLVVMSIVIVSSPLRTPPFPKPSAIRKCLGASCSRMPRWTRRRNSKVPWCKLLADAAMDEETA